VRAHRSLLSLLAGMVVSACGSEGSTGPPPDPPLVNAPDDVVAGLKDAWNRRDAAAVAALLSDDFVFHVSPADADSAGVPDLWARDTELTATEHLFAGEEGVGPDGTPQSPADPRFSFGLTVLPDEDGWTVRDDPPFEGTLSRRYESSMTVQYANFDLDFIAGAQVFFVAEEPGTDQTGAAVRQYRLRAWQDLGQTPVSRHRAFTWGFLKALYREVYSGGRPQSHSSAGAHGAAGIAK